MSNVAGLADEKVEAIRPRGCKCNPDDWGTIEIPPVCRRYELDGIDHPCCVRCEHPEECHRGSMGRFTQPENGSWWLIEAGSPAGYYCGPGDWCSNPNHAEQFPSRADAEKVSAEMKFANGVPRVVEHSWE